MYADVARIRRDMGDINRVVTGAMRDVESAIGAATSMLARFTSVGAIVSAMGMISRAAEEASQVQLRLEAVLRATGNTSGYTSKQLAQLADHLADLTKFDDESFKKATANILRFGQVSGQQLERTLKLSADLAAFMGTDLPGAADTLAKAIAAPGQGIERLQRTIGYLDEEQLKAIKSMDQMGDRAGAQRAILEALEKRIGGVAETMNSGLTKATHDLAKAFNELAEAVGKTDNGGIKASFFSSMAEGLREMKTAVEGDWTVKLIALFNAMSGGIGSKLGLFPNLAAGPGKPTQDAAAQAVAAAAEEAQRVSAVRKMVRDQDEAAEKVATENQRRRAEELYKQRVAYAEAELKADEMFAKDFAEAWKHADEFVANEDKKMHDERQANMQAEIDANEMFAQDFTEAWAAYAQYQVDQQHRVQIEVEKSWGAVADVAGDFFGDLMVNGRKAFDSLRHHVKQLLADMIALFAKRWILSMAAGGTMAGSAANAFASDGTGSIASLGLSAAGSAASSYLFGAAGGATETGLLTAGTEGLIGAGGFAATAGTAVSAATGGAIAAETAASFIPIIGWVIAIGLVLYSIFGHKGGGPKLGGSFLGDFGAGGNLLGDLTGTLDRSRHLNDETQLDSTAQQISSSLATSISRTVAQLGGTSQGFQVGVGFNRDPAGTAPSMASVLLRDASGRTLLEQSNRNVSRDDGALEAELGLQGQRALIAALQASDLPKEIADIIDSLVANSASAEEIQRVLAAAVDMKNVLDHIGELHIKGLDVDALKVWQREGETLSQTLARVGGAFAQFDDAFMSDAQKVAAAQELVRKTFADLGEAVPADSAAFYQLVHSIDVSTESGRHMVETLLQVAPAFLTASNGIRAAVDAMYQTAAQMSVGFGRQYAEAALRMAAQQWMAIPGAVGNGWSVDQVIQEIAGLIGGGTSSNPHGFSDALAYVQSLGPEAVAAFTSLLNAYQAWQQSMDQTAGSLPPLTGGITDLGDSAADAARRLADAKANLRGYIDSLLISDQLSPLSPMDRLGAARSQFEALLAAAQHGDVTAMGQLSGASDAYLRIARDIFASGSSYVDIFNQVVGELAGVSGYDADWQSKLTSVLPTTGSLASQDDIERLGFRIMQALGGVAAANDEAVQVQTSALKTASAPARR